jgi:hypothetical protein
MNSRKRAGVIFIFFNASGKATYLVSTAVKRMEDGLKEHSCLVKKWRRGGNPRGHALCFLGRVVAGRKRSAAGRPRPVRPQRRVPRNGQTMR